MMSDTDTYPIPIEWEGWPRVVCLGPKILFMAISIQRVTRVPLLDFGVEVLDSRKKFHVVRASIFNLADKLEHEKTQGEQELNFKLRKLSLAQGAIKAAIVREGLRLRAYPKCLSQMSVNPTWLQILKAKDTRIENPDLIHFSG